MSKNEKKSNAGFVLGFSSRGIGMAMETVLLLQITYYATEVVGLNVALVGTLFLALKFLDGVTDIIMGYIIDRTHTRWGKARPYELFMIPMGVLTVAMFSVPDVSLIGKTIYIMVLFALIQTVCQTALNTSENIFLIRATEDDQLRAKAQSVQGVLGMIIPGAIGVILPNLMNTWGKEPGGWTKIALLIAVPSTVLGMIRFFTLKEIETEKISEQPKVEKKKEKITFGESVKALFSNKYCMMIALVLCLTASLNQLNASIGSYYYTWVVGDLTKLGMVNLLSMIAPVFILFFPMGMKKFGAANFIKGGLAIAIAGNIIRFAANTNMAGLMIGSFLSNVGSGVIAMVSGVFIAHCIDYGEWKTGKRVEAVLNCVVGFSKKIGQGVSSAIIGLGLGAAGYVGGAAVQSSEALMAIRVCFAVVPLGLCVIAFIILCFYDLEKKIPEIRKNLAERKVEA